jgi:carbamoyl-phosphate synthase large subunit
MVHLLLTSAGTDSTIALCNGLRSYFGDEIRLAGVDVKPMVPCQRLLDHFEQVPPRKSPDLIPAILRLCRNLNVSHVWPLSTEDQALIARHRDGDLKNYTTICSSLSAIEIANDKIDLYEFARNRGLPVPRYRIVDSLDTLRAAASELGYPGRPVVLKTARGAGAMGLKIIRSDVSGTEMFLSRLNRDVSLEVVIEQLQRMLSWPRLLLMEYLPGEEFSVDVLLHRGTWYGGVVRQRDESLFGLATNAVAVDRPDLLDLARTFALQIGLEYVNNIQFRVAKTREPMIMEINPRVPGTIELSIAAGCNLPAVALALSLGRSDTLPPPKIGTRILRYFGGVIFEP